MGIAGSNGRYALVVRAQGQFASKHLVQDQPESVDIRLVVYDAILSTLLGAA